MDDLYKRALKYHNSYPRGKIAIKATKQLNTQDELALAYSPGVAAPCLEIQKNYDDIYKYTNKGNMVAVITNGTAVLGLGNLGAAASKPVMEGKSVLFKKFGRIDAIDVEVSTEDCDRFIDVVSAIASSWGGINLEDIRAPDCFKIEEELIKRIDVPVFHDDQHGTAIITTAALLNAAEISKKNFEDLVVTINGAGSAGMACTNLIQAMGVKKENCIMCDRSGVIYKDRENSMNPWKEKYAIDTNMRTLSDAIKESDVFLGLSVGNVVSKDMVRSMPKNPIIFAMANPDPEISPEDILDARSDAIIATGRSDYPNQVNNVLGFPYIFRGALDVHSKMINRAMKIAAARAIAELAKRPITDQVKKIYNDHSLEFSRNYIIPTPFDHRLLSEVSSAVAKSAIETGIARNVIDLDEYKRGLSIEI